ncbi:hypothetical protein JK361_38670 [Streptomyces sp. 5-8]|uniref:Uncharacterized protein n=1 Tax=Streptomyces musisoli TaxID=2802280 RepID=A0ABS1PEF7_9ACTN|nr:DUF6233 domain-containing protein [Streptomyces musisoli]MBL1110410.1 hypothetical protein [Streptomyces musisoli]
MRAILAFLDQGIAETVAIYLRLQTRAVRRALSAVEWEAPDARRLPPQPRSAPQAPAREAADGFVVKKRLHAGHTRGATVHRADCTVIQRDANPISPDDARQVLTGDRAVFTACEFCQPGTAVGTSVQRRSPQL